MVLPSQRRNPIACPIISDGRPAIRNARTHGEPTTVELTIEAHSRSAMLCVSDDGRGFCPDDGDDRGDHFGLRLMRDLADHAGGDLQVLSSPGHGTLVRLKVPLA